MDIGILVTIRSLLPNLAPVERRVAQAVLDDPGGAARGAVRRSAGRSISALPRVALKKDEAAPDGAASSGGAAKCSSRPRDRN